MAEAMADDLRAILAASCIAIHLERIGNYAENTAKRSRHLSQPISAELDTVYTNLFQHLFRTMSKETRNIADGTQLLLIAKRLERADDHVTDIAEEIYLMVTGIPLQGPRPQISELS